jgi:hypothetical protein
MADLWHVLLALSTLVLPLVLAWWLLRERRSPVRRRARLAARQ